MTALPRRNWTEDEVTLALALYVQIPFSKLSSRNPRIVAFADAVGRTPSSVAMKLVNLAHLDPKLKARGVSGMSNGSRTDRLVWERFIGADAQVADLAPLFNEADGAAARLSVAESAYVLEPPKDEDSPIDAYLSQLAAASERTALVRVRVHQDMFRNAVLSSYRGRCAITGLGDAGVIEAAHILPWSEGKAFRLQPSNGIALSATMHRAFDADLIGITPDFRVEVSKRLLGAAAEGSPGQLLLEAVNGREIMLPDRFQPNRDFLSDRYREFRKAA